VTPATSAFPSDFYATAATVIPVLFLAFAVQGRTYETMVAAGIRYTRPYLTKKSTFRSVAAAVVGAVLIALAAAIITLVFGGEVVALNALSTGSNTRGGQNVVYSSVFVLLIGVIVPPVWIMIRALVELLKEAWRSASEEQPSTPDRQVEERAGSQEDSAKDDPADALQQNHSGGGGGTKARHVPGRAAKARGRSRVAGLLRRAALPP
jgi:hypothetical protein